MISLIPAFEFMQQLVGVYRTADALAALKVTRIGYGQLMELHVQDSLIIAGVIGAQRNGAELAAQIGAPNVSHFFGQLRAPKEIVFEEPIFPATLVIAREQDEISLSLQVSGKSIASHLFRRCE